MRVTSRRIFRCLVSVAAMVFLLSCTKEGRRSRDEMVRTVFLRVSTNLNTKADVFEDPADEEKVVNSLRVYAFTNGHLAGYHQQMSEEHLLLLGQKQLLNKLCIQNLISRYLQIFLIFQHI